MIGQKLWLWPLKTIVGIPAGRHPGSFGYKRSYYFHTGVDLYCKNGDSVFAVEQGRIIKTGQFTGSVMGHVQQGEAYWEDTEYIAIVGASGVVVYGEITPSNVFNVGDVIPAGVCIGRVKRVLPLHKARPDIPGHSTSMLHLELYSELEGEPIGWYHGPDGDEPQPKELLDPTEKLSTAEYKYFIPNLW